MSLSPPFISERWEQGASFKAPLFESLMEQHSLIEMGADLTPTAMQEPHRRSRPPSCVIDNRFSIDNDDVAVPE